MIAVPQTAALDERLVQTSLEILAEEGLEGLTLRRVAREAGVSHGAPLRHFRSLADLLSEVAARGFALLSRALDTAATTLPPGAGSLARLEAAGRAYVDVAVANPSLFSLMFRVENLDVTNAAFERDSGTAFEQLLHHVRAAQDAGWRADRDTRLLAGSVWAAVHGFAALWTQGAFSGPIPGASFEDALATTLELVLGTTRGETA